MPNQPIKNIQLKNGSKYPIGEVWREPIVEGHALDYPVSLDTTGAGSLAMTINRPGEEPETMTLTLFHITDTVLTDNELAWASLNAVGNTPSYPRIVVINSDTPIVMDIPTIIIMMLSMQVQTAIDPSDCTIVGSIPAMVAFSGSSAGPVLAMAFSEAATATTIEITAPIAKDVNATVELVATVPAAGTYFMTPIELNFAPGSTVDGTLSICKWHMPRWFDPGRVCAITNGPLITLLRDFGTFDLTSAPALNERIRDAAELGEQLALMPGQGASSGVSVDFGGTTWTFLDGSTIEYSESNNTLTYTAGS